MDSPIHLRIWRYRLIFARIRPRRNFNVRSPLDAELFGCERSALSGRAPALRAPPVLAIFGEMRWLSWPAAGSRSPHPPPFDTDGNILWSDFDTANVAYLPPVLHGGEIRACGDFKYGLINICAADFTPIALPTWGHIGQIASDLPNHPRVWPFMKAAHRSANKNLPPNPDQSEFCIAAHRPLGDSNWHGFACRALLFGAAAAVRRYNSPSRAAAVIINRLFGLPPSHLF